MTKRCSRGEPAGIVVGNYSAELESLKHMKNIYFAQNTASGGIIEDVSNTITLFKKPRERYDAESSNALKIKPRQILAGALM